MLKLSLENLAQFMSGKGSTIILIAGIFCGSALGKLFPNIGPVISNHIDYTVILLVFLLLFEVRFQNFFSSLDKIQFIIVALITNFIFIPAIGFAIALIFLSKQPLFFIGLVIYFMSPCTDWFLAFTRLANGNTALGAVLIPINMIVQLVLYPIYLHLFGIGKINLDTSTIFITLTQWVLAPLLFAIALRFLIEKMMNKVQLQLIQNITSIAIPILLALLVTQTFTTNIGTLILHTTILPWILCAILLFFIIIFFLSKGISTVMKLPYEDHVLMSMTTTARNAPLMLAITMAILPEKPIIYAAIIIGMLIEFPYLITLKVILNKKRTSYER